MPDLTERWMDFQFQRGARALRVFDIFGTHDIRAAEATPGLPREGQKLWVDGRLLAEAPDWERIGADSWRASILYTRRAIEATGDKLDEPAEVFWRTATTSEPVDRSVQGLPIVNSARMGFDPAPQRDFNTKFLVFSRWETQYDVTRATAFENTVNDQPISLYDGLRFDMGELCLRTYEPTEPMTLVNPPAPVVRVQYTFETRKNKFRPGDAFQFRGQDRGTHGFFVRPDDQSTPGRPVQPRSGFITTPGGRRVSGEVLLDGAGKPLDKTFTVEGRTPVAGPPWPPEAVQNGWIAVEKTAYAAWLHYDIYPFMPFAALGLS